MQAARARSPVPVGGSAARGMTVATVTAALAGGLVTVAPVGVLACAVAVSRIEPEWMSEAVTAWRATEWQVVDSPGARVAVGQDTAGAGPAGRVKVSVTVIALNAVLPVLVTV